MTTEETTFGDIFDIVEDDQVIQDYAEYRERGAEIFEDLIAEALAERDEADLQEGLRQSAAGEVVDLGDFEQYAVDDS